MKFFLSADDLTYWRMHYVLHIKWDPEICISWMIYTHEERNDAFPGCMYTVNVNLWFNNISS